VKINCAFQYQETYQKKKKSFYVKRIEVLSPRDAKSLGNFADGYQTATNEGKLPIFFDDGCFKG
jgi:hypothetical protein